MQYVWDILQMVAQRGWVGVKLYWAKEMIDKNTWHMFNLKHWNVIPIIRIIHKKKDK